MSIWFQPFSLEAIERYSRGSLNDHLGIRFTEVGDDYLTGTMPVDARTRQPYGILHGGASVALAETLGSVSANHCVDPGRLYCVGQEINANHIRSVREGLVTGTARPLHLGGRSQVWEVRMVDEQRRLVCISRMTLAVLVREQPFQGGQGGRS